MQTQTSASPISIRFPGDLKNRIQSLAATQQRSTNALVIQAVEAFVDRAEKRESLRQEGIAAWEEYKRTGLHLTQEELEAWADKISQGERMPMPKCHV
jgi:predicted transcriptional regulator